MAVASRLFYTQGYNLTGVNQLIDEADIARGSLYNHFESKTDVLIAYMDAFLESWFSGMEQLLDSIKDPKKRLLALVDYRIQNQQHRGYRGCPLIKANDEISQAEMAASKKIRAGKDRMRALVATLVQESGHKKLLTDEDLSNLIYLMIEGALTSAAIYRNAADLRIAKTVILRLI